MTFRQSGFFDHILLGGASVKIYWISLIATILLLVSPALLPGLPSTQDLPLYGDANNDGKIDRDDIFATVEHILSKTIAPGQPDANQDGAINVGDVVYLVDTLPPVDPGQIADPNDPTVSTDILESTAFLYTGPDAIQTGVKEGYIKGRTVVVLRGKMLDREGNPLPNVGVYISDNPNYGRTRSRADGMFDMVVNGGSLLVVKFEKNGYLPVQRRVQLPWRRFFRMPDVHLVTLDATTSFIDLSTTVPIQIARGSLVSDDAGGRQATVLFPRGVKASMTIWSPHQVIPLNSITVRATEYTVGDKGPNTMPAELPCNSGYTYCVEVSADEAMAAGADTVSFDKPLVFYLENFIGFPVGSAVPVGYFDKRKGIWLPSKNGRIVKILAITGGMADLDVDGDGDADTGTPLDDLGIDDEERGKIAGLYTEGTSLWRVHMDHFTPWDCNWPYGPPPWAVPPKPPLPPNFFRREDGYGNGSPTSSPGALARKCRRMGGCVISPEDQILNEAVSIQGTPFQLCYSSDRVSGRKVFNQLRMDMTGDTVEQGVKRVDLEITVAGQTFRQSFDPVPNLSYTYTWDGKDAYGRTMFGTQPATARYGYVYDAEYYAASNNFDESFAQFSGIPITADEPRGEVILWNEWTGGMGGCANAGIWGMDFIRPSCL